ncbi:DegT/DnrJ/EryC1/StrS family aminotransferase [Azospirillum sp.]|uniref:DegT/DnrJ/EryC1/StrS family aminotransferase n=1 Tax=Azospirillum sp. TaxID=34012 RepID=UPI003D71FB29
MAAIPSAFDQPVYVTRPMLPPLASYVERLSQIWSSGWLTNGGPQHIALEKALGAYFSNPNISLFSNGTTALVTACQALRLSGEVITTPFTFPATPHVLSWNKITPVFADIDAATMNLDPANIEPLITDNTTAILAVHVFGTPCDVEGLQTIADRHGLRVIYDAAHAFGSRIHGRSVTDFGDATMLSFHATKLFHTAEGGALVLRDPQVKNQVDLLKNFGIKDEFTVLMPGINGKMSELQAALGLIILDMVEDEQARRRGVADIYRQRLGTRPGITLPVVQEGVDVSQQYFAIRVDDIECGVSRDHIYDEMKKFNVMSRKYFYPLCSDYIYYRTLPSASHACLPVAHKVASEVLCLPFFGALTLNDAHRICDIIDFIVSK